MTSLRERALTARTLLCLLKGLQGVTTTVELRNEISIQGKITTVDVDMGMHMVRATVTSLDGTKTKYDNFFVKGPLVRFVHIPDHISIVSTIQQQLDMISGKRQYSDKRTKKPARRRLPPKLEPLGNVNRNTPSGSEASPTVSACEDNA